VAEFSARGVQAAAFAANLADERQVETLVQDVLVRLGRVDVLVNCAAIWDRKRLEDVGAADVRAHFEANVLGTFLCARSAGLAMVRQPEGGCIVNLGDWAEARPYRDFAAYFASKGAIPTLTRDLAVELGTRNPRVRVNCVLPGPVLFPPDLPDEERRRAVAGTLVQREGKPENVAQAILALVDNDFITGACLPVDGGRTVFAPE
jgi:pteridine reductase